MIRLHISQICPKQLEVARAIAMREHDGFLVFDNRSREYQFLFERKRMPDPDEMQELRRGGCCDPPSRD